MAVRAHHLLGREEETDALLGLLQARDLLPSAAVLVGEPGIGKTALWLAGIEAAEAAGYHVLTCRPSEAESSFSFAGLTDLIGDVVERVLPELPPLQQRALEAALLIGEGEVRADGRATAAGFLSVLKTLASSEPLLVAVDDLQWLDAPSLASLRFALPRLRAESVATLLAVRGEVPDWLPRGLPDERLLTIELGRLSLGAIHELLQARLGTPFPRPVLLRIWETSGGNPFFALELARALQRRGRKLDLGEALPIPGTLEALVGERLDGLSTPALECARVVAALASPTVRTVEAVVGRSAHTGLTDAVASKVLEIEGDRIRFSHPLLASAVSSRTPLESRRSLHQRLAQVVPSAEEGARHLALATMEPSRDAASLLDDAARRAHIRGAPAAAAELAEQALRLTPVADAEDARGRRLAAADRHFEAGDNDRAIALLDQALATAAPGAERATVLVHLAPVVKDVRGPRDAVAMYRKALVEAAGSDCLEAGVHLSLAELMRFSEGAELGVAHAELAVRAAARAGDPALRCRALAAYGLMHFNGGHGIPRAEMEEALALERTLPDWPLIDGPTWAFCHQLWWSGEVDSARPVLHEFREALKARDDPEEAIALWHLTFLEWRAGNWELAARHLFDSHSLTTQAGRVAMWPAQESPSTALAAHRGEIAAARVAAENAVAEAQAAGIAIAESGHRWVLGFIELSLGNAALALEHLRRSYEVRETFVSEPAMRLELADTLEALITVGELDEAEQILLPWEERARALDRAWALALCARCRALLLAARGDVVGALDQFDRALVEHARSVDPFHHARTLLAFGMTQRRAKRRAAARATLERALEIFERLGAPLWSERAEGELARIGGRAPSKGELTESERRIAVLVADGRTNREVAAALFLGQRTVETHLTHIYAKLGIRSRTELARRLH